MGFTVVPTKGNISPVEKPFYQTCIKLGTVWKVEKEGREGRRIQCHCRQCKPPPSEIQPTRAEFQDQRAVEINEGLDTRDGNVVFSRPPH